MRQLRLLALFLAVAAIAAACGGGDNTDTLQFDATLNGISLDDGDRSSPIDFNPDEPALVELDITNQTGTDQTVRHLRLEGEILGFRFAHANTQTNFTVPANGNRRFGAEIDFFDLGQQVNGHLDARLSLFDEERERIGSERFFIDVDGSINSALGLSFLMVVAFAALAIVTNWWGVLRGALPANRFNRGLRFAAAAAAAVVAIFLLLPLVGLWVPAGAVWVPILAIATLAAFALGYVSPTPDDELDDDDESLDLRVRSGARK